MPRLRRDAGTTRKREYQRQNLERRRLWRCRCSRRSCAARITLRKHPGVYARGPKRCWCGAPLRVDWYRTLWREAKRSTCHCSAAHYPHRRGWCEKARGGVYQPDAALADPDW